MRLPAFGAEKSLDKSSFTYKVRPIASSAKTFTNAAASNKRGWETEPPCDSSPCFFSGWGGLGPDQETAFRNAMDFASSECGQVCPGYPFAAAGERQFIDFGPDVPPDERWGCVLDGCCFNI